MKKRPVRTRSNLLRPFLSLLFAAAIVSDILLPGLFAYADDVDENTNSGLNVYSSVYSEPSEYGHLNRTLVDSDGNTVDLGGGSTEKICSVETLPSSYDLRTYNRVTGVKDQGIYGTCWAFGAISAAESELITDGLASSGNTDYSEDHLVWFSGKKSSAGEGLNNNAAMSSGYSAYNVGGNCYIASSLFSSGVGVELESNAPYGTGNYASSRRYTSYASLRNSYMLAQDNSDTRSNMNAIKQYIINEGALDLSYYHDEDGLGTSGTAVYSYYLDTMTADDVNHDVSLIGWDDNYAITNFRSGKRPSAKGAWLIKNSHGTSFYDGGYMWLSYYDTSVSDIYAFDFSSADDYDHIYEYDTYTDNAVIYYEGATSGRYANIFMAAGDENLLAVSILPWQPNINYTIKVYKGVGSSPESGTLQSASTTSGSKTYWGYYTIPLKAAVSLSAGEKYSVVVTFSTTDGNEALFPFEGDDYTDSYANCNVSFSADGGQSFFYNPESRTWLDTSYTINNYHFNNACIKAFTTDAQSVPVTDVSVTPTSVNLAVNRTKQLTATVTPSNAADKSVTWDSDNLSVATVSSSGLVTAKAIGTAYITATTNDGGFKATCAVTVSELGNTPSLLIPKNLFTLGVGYPIFVPVTVNSNGYEGDVTLTVSVNSEDVVAAGWESDSFTMDEPVYLGILPLSVGSCSVSVTLSNEDDTIQYTSDYINVKAEDYYQTYDVRYRSSDFTPDFGDNFSPVSYDTSDSNILSVSDGGVVSINGSGSAIIAAIDSEGNTRTVEVTVNIVWWQWIIIILLMGWIWY